MPAGGNKHVCAARDEGDVEDQNQWVLFVDEVVPASLEAWGEGARSEFEVEEEDGCGESVAEKAVEVAYGCFPRWRC